MARILVVDDHPTNRDVITTLLGYYGHSISEAADGGEALSLAIRLKPDLIISDVLMPTMDGYEFVRRLRQEPALTSKPVIFYTAHYLEREALTLAEKCGVCYVLPKPADPAEVIRVVETALGSPSQTAAAPDDIAREHLELITTRLSQTAEDLSVANLRLQALIEAGQRLATEHDPPRLVDQYARVTREILGAGLCVIGVFEQGGNLRHVGTSGLSGPAVDEIRNGWRPDSPSPGLDSHAQHFSIDIRTPKTFLGWLCVADKLGGGPFSEEDEQLARTLAAQLAVAYENALLYEQVKRHAEGLEDKVRERTRDLEAAQQELESFTFAVSHDLRAPLHTLHGLSSLLEDRFGPKFEPEAIDLVRRIHKTSSKMADLVKSLLELARISKQDIEFEDVALDTVLEEALEDVRGAAKDRRIEWRIHPLPQSRGSATLLKQVFVNLLSNAVKFTGPMEAAWIEVGQTRAGGDPAIYVKDNGVGFDPQKADGLFGVFKRLHPQNQFQGSGAGLSIVQRIVTRHGGRIWAESAPGHGAGFYFTLNGAKGEEAVARVSPLRLPTRAVQQRQRVIEPRP